MGLPGLQKAGDSNLLLVILLFKLSSSDTL
jgi:hypothetical protein